MAMEEEFQTEIPDEEAEKISTGRCYRPREALPSGEQKGLLSKRFLLDGC